MTDTPDDDFTECLLVCVGVCTVNGGKKGRQFRMVEPNGSLGESVAFDRKTAGTVGSVYSVMADPTRSRFRITFKKWVRAWGIEADTLMWRTAEDELLARERRVVMEKTGKAKAITDAMAGLEPMKLAYHKTDRFGRAVIVALIMQYLEGRI